jgi:glucokinase
VDARQLADETAIKNVSLINDLEAHAYGINDLDPEDLITLNPGKPCPGNAALIAAGTGLGEAGLFWDGTQHRAFAGEGGHADFAPTNDLELALTGYLMKKFGHVSWERVLSGPGIANIYDFLRDSKIEPEPQWLKDELNQAPDRAVLISQYGLEGKAAICGRTLDIFASAYGAEAGNMALRLLAVGGVFVSGGIAGKVMAKLKGPVFMSAFVAKGRMQPLLEAVPVKVIINEHIGLLGAARYAVRKAAV